MHRFPDKIDSKFRYILVASARAEQIMRGAPTKVEQGADKASRVAMREVSQDLVAWELGQPAEPEPEPAEEVAEESDEEVN